MGKTSNYNNYDVGLKSSAIAKAFFSIFCVYLVPITFTIELQYALTLQNYNTSILHIKSSHLNFEVIRNTNGL